MPKVHWDRHGCHGTAKRSHTRTMAASLLAIVPTTKPPSRHDTATLISWVHHLSLRRRQSQHEAAPSPLHRNQPLSQEPKPFPSPKSQHPGRTQ